MALGHCRSALGISLSGPTHTYQDYYTFVTPEFQPKALYLEAQSYAAGR